MNANQQLIEHSIEFLDGFKNHTPGNDLEQLLNEKHGPGTETFDTLAKLVKIGVRDGWAAKSPQPVGRAVRGNVQFQHYGRLYGK